MILGTMIARVGRAQSTEQDMLSAIEQNNVSLSVDRAFWDARRLAYKTGLTLPNPEVQVQYLFGSPATAGNQTDVFVVQPFDFPGSYARKRHLSKEKANAAEPALVTRRQDILMQARLVFFELIYRNKLSDYFQDRQAELDELLVVFQKKLDQGDGTILDLNKVRLQALGYAQMVRINEIRSNELHMQLMELNGGQPVEHRDTVYPEMVLWESIDQLEKAFTQKDPVRQSLEQSSRIAEKQLDVVKATRLPGFELGYHYQGILGQQFNGVHVGLTLPIWEHRHREEAQRLEILYTDLEVKGHEVAHKAEIRELYDRHIAIRQLLVEFTSTLGGTHHSDLLKKALDAGEMTVSEYFYEMSAHHEARMRLFELEFEYYTTLVKMNRFLL